MVSKPIRRRIIDEKNGWTIDEWLTSDDDAVDRSKRHYYFREQLAVRHELNSKVARRAAGFTLIGKDLRTLQAWIASLREMLLAVHEGTQEPQESLMPSDPAVRGTIFIARALFLAIVTTYGKLFVTADGRGTILNAKEWVDEKHRVPHDYLMHLRHSFAAHGGEGVESCKTVLAIDYSPSNRTAPRVFTELFQPTVVTVTELERVEALVSDLQMRARAALEKVAAVLNDEVDATFTDDRLTFLRIGAPGTRLVR